LGVRWKSPSAEFDIAYMDVNLTLTPPSHYIWHVQRSRIEQFKLIARLDELERLPEVSSLIPTNAVYIW
jgi:hypothetical protein